MALTDEVGGGVPATMLVSPTGMPYASQGGFGGGFDGNGWWIILLFLLLIGGRGWGFGNEGNGSNLGGTLYPWLNQSEQISGGFQSQMLNDNITSIRDGVTGISTQLCNGFAGIEQSANARQIADMQTAFAAQTAMAQGFNGLQSQFAQCCCDNRTGLADLKYTVATENCADRQALNEGVRDIIASQTASTQRILDQLCNDKIDAKNDTIAQLRQELLYARGQASQELQTAALRAGQVAEVDALYNRLNECPVGTVPVYGRQPIFTCGGNCGCGCGA